MKTRIVKAILLLAFVLFHPFISQAREFPPTKHSDAFSSSWLLALMAIGALYGLSKMWTSRQTSR